MFGCRQNTYLRRLKTKKRFFMSIQFLQRWFSSGLVPGHRPYNVLHRSSKKMTQSCEDIEWMRNYSIFRGHSDAVFFDSWSHFRSWTSLQVLEKGPRFPMYMISSSRSKHIWNSVHLSMKEGRLLFVLFVCCVVSPKLQSASFAALFELLESPWWGGGGGTPS